IVDKIDDKTLELLEILNRQNQGHLIIFGEEVSSRTNYFMSRHLSRIHISNALCVIESQGSRERLGGHLAQGNGKEHWQSILKHLKTLFHGVAEENLQALLLSSQPLQGSKNIKIIPEMKIKISQTSDSVRVEILSSEEKPTLDNDEMFKSITFITGKIMGKPQASQLMEGIGLLLCISNYLSTPQYKLSDNNILSRSIESQLSANIKPEKLLSDLITIRDRISNSYHIKTQKETYGLSDDLIPELSLLNTIIKRIQAIIEFKEA
ncbi:hypothetical protein KBD45_05820, partial [Candidatus Dojkabacteria bacterium]|nr:hypothetical protein [Candidatus Dojkabacteria bacterium]